MPFPLTLGPNTYVRSDFTDPDAYAKNIPAFLTDLGQVEGIVEKQLALSPIDFSASTHTVTIASSNWIVKGEGVFICHTPSNSYQFTKVTNVSGTALTLARQTDTPYQGAGTESSSVYLLRDLPENRQATDMVLDELVVASQGYGEDFLGSMDGYYAGTYDGSTFAPFNGSLVDGYEDPQANLPNLDLFIFGPRSRAYVKKAPGGIMPGRGVAEFYNGADKYTGAYLRGINFAQETCLCFQIDPLKPTGTLLVGWQMASVTPSTDLCGYPYEFVHGAPNRGPQISFQYNYTSLTHPLLNVEISGGVLTTTLTVDLSSIDLAQWLQKPLTVVISQGKTSVDYRIYNEVAEVRGTLPHPVAVQPGLRRPFFGVNGSLLVDYFWSR